MRLQKRLQATLLTLLVLGAAACSGQTLNSDAPQSRIGIADEAYWTVPRAYEGLCWSPIEIRFIDEQGSIRIGVMGVLSEGATIKGWLQTVPTMYFDVEASVAKGVVITHQEYPRLELKVPGAGNESAFLKCDAPIAASPSPTPAPSDSPVRGALSIVSLNGYECYTGKSSAYWDDTRVVLELRVENLGNSKSLKVWVRAKTERGGPVSKPRGMQNLEFGEDFGVYGENAPTSLAFNGIEIGPEKRVTFRWSADYFWAPGAVYVEVWNGAPGAGDGQQGAASYVLDSSSPQNGLKSCSRY